MNTVVNVDNQEIWEQLSSLRLVVDKTRKTAVKRRQVKQPFLTNLEYMLGAFLEMYEPHLGPIVCKLCERGYAAETSSGFGGTKGEYQTLNGYFSIDHITRSKLEKIKVKLREHERCKSLMFWPDKADLNHIKKKWLQIVDTLPDRGMLASPSESFDAVEFRRKHAPKDSLLKRKQIFEQLRFSIESKARRDLEKRIVRNPRPSLAESRLGLFVEELEPQVKQAVLTLNNKGYSIDASGFLENACDQMMEGDFRLSERTKVKIQAIGATVETNPSGYTMLRFSPLKADIKKIKQQWHKIVSLIPDQKQIATPSMTRKAREFREKFR